MLSDLWSIVTTILALIGLLVEYPLLFLPLLWSYRILEAINQIGKD